MDESAKLFDSPNVRCCWNERSHEWYYSIMDVVAALTGSSNPQREVEHIKSESAYIRRNWKYMAKPMVVPNKDGDKRRIIMANATSMLRIVLLIHTKAAEPYKLWACRAAYEQLDKMNKPQ